MRRRLPLLALVVCGKAWGQDLALQSLTGPTTPVPGSTNNQFRPSIRNLGASGVQNASITLRSSADAVFSADDVDICTEQTGGVGPNQIASPFVFCTWPLTATRPYVVARITTTSGPTDPDTSNNDTSYQLAAAPQAIDLSPAAVTVPSAPVLPGEVVDIRWRLDDNGSTPAPLTRAVLSWSTNSTWEASDPEMCTQAVPSGTSGTLTTPGCLVPQSAAGGTTAYVIVRVDVDGAASETNETNNTAVGTVGVERPPTPGNVDLRLASIGTLPPNASVAQGARFDVGYLVESTGSEASPPVVLAFRLSADATWDDGDTPLCQTAVATLPAFSGTGTPPRSSASITCDLPASAPAGAAFVVGRVDAADAVLERREGDNTAWGTLTVIAPEVPDAPDLVPALGNLSPVRPGDRFDLPYQLANIGTTAAGSSRAEAWLSQDERLSGSDRPLCNGLTPPLDPADVASSTLPGCQTLPGEAPGDWYVLLVADAGAVVDESDEDNNIATVPLRLLGDDPLPVDSDPAPADSDPAPADPPDDTGGLVPTAPIGELGCACDAGSGRFGGGLLLVGLALVLRRRRS